MTAEELASVLGRHLKWVRGEDGGARANLSGANLSGADLRSANLGALNVAQIGPIGSRRDYVVAMWGPDVDQVRTGCFNGTLSEFEAAVASTHGNDVHGAPLPRGHRAPENDARAGGRARGGRVVIHAEADRLRPLLAAALHRARLHQVGWLRSRLRRLPPRRVRLRQLRAGRDRAGEARSVRQARTRRRHIALTGLMEDQHATRT